ncbi:MAG: YmdB family metallophosphoesterase [candidate division KSB1 bacterium]|nr:YmdB family metallophosphoesterase [candidate division KSB1 bacterium]
MIRILFVADVVGKRGVKTAVQALEQLRRAGVDPDYCFANGENLKNGRGLDRGLAAQLFDNGIDALTTGNHVWDRQSDNDLLGDARVLRPANYPDGLPGHGWWIYQKQGRAPVALINLQGRTFLFAIDCPFRTADRILADPAIQSCPVRVVDVHAEATAEKQALGWYLDGRVSAVIGTHTHVQTADERILDQGTGYITDVGMTGSHGGVIGTEKWVSIRRFLRQTPEPVQLARGYEIFHAVLLEVDESSGRCVTIRRIREPVQLP